VEEVQEVVEQQEITSKYNPNIIVFLPAITIFLSPAFVFYGIACCVTHFIVLSDRTIKSKSSATNYSAMKHARQKAVVSRDDLRELYGRKKLTRELIFR
jgi:hypothetical protein